jgi:hypothetical protein
MGVADNLRKLDAHSSVSKEFRVYTIQGAFISVLTVIGTWGRFVCVLVPVFGLVDCTDHARLTPKFDFSCV